jgi:hypothetical protein
MIGLSIQLCTDYPSLSRKSYIPQSFCQSGMLPINFNNLGSKTLPEAYPKGFDVIINGRTIRVFPLPRR